MRLKKIIADKRGAASVQFMIYAALMAFLIFGAIDYWLVQQRINHVEHVKEYYLDRVRLEGWLSSADETALSAVLTNAGYTDIQIACSAKESSPFTQRVLRNPEDLNGSEVFLEIKCKPQPQPFALARLIKAGEPGPFEIVARGRALSERVTP